MEELNNKYLQGLAKQIQTLIGEALPLLIEGSDCANHPLELACELCAEACPYCIDKGDLASAYIIIDSIGKIKATMGRLHLVDEQEQYVLDKVVKLDCYGQELKRWIDKGGCPQSLIRKAKETGTKMDDDGNWIYPEAEAKEVAPTPSNEVIIEELAKHWLTVQGLPKCLCSEQGKKMLKVLLDYHYCTIGEDKLIWEEGPTLWSYAIRHICYEMNLLGENNEVPWKKMNGVITLRQDGKIQSAKQAFNDAAKFDRKPPKEFENLLDLWELKKDV